MEYWLKNKGEQYEITSSEIVQCKKGEESRYKIENIEKITICKSASMDKGGIPFLAIESYYYARIRLISGDDLVITCLLTPKLRKYLEG